MTEKPPKEVKDEPGADERFALGLGNALRMKPRPHSQQKKGRGAKPAPKE